MNADPPGNAPKAFTLADFTSEALILPQLVARDTPGVIGELSEAFQRSDSAWDARALAEAARHREEQMSTVMDFGAAFPHVRSDACLRLQFALGRAGSPFKWGKAGPRVQLVFLNAVPDDDAMGYLRLISGMARLGKDAALLKQLRTAGTARELLAVLAKVPVRK